MVKKARLWLSCVFVKFLAENLVSGNVKKKNCTSTHFACLIQFGKVFPSFCNENATENGTYGVLKKGWRCRNARKATAGFRS